MPPNNPRYRFWQGWYGIRDDWQAVDEYCNTFATGTLSYHIREAVVTFIKAQRG